MRPAPGAGSLVVLPPGLAGTILALPAVRALAGSGRHLLALVPESLAPLAALAPGVEAVMVRRTDWRETAESVRAAAPAEAILLADDVGSAWIALRAGIAPRTGYASPLRLPLLTPAVRRPPRRVRRSRHAAEAFTELLAALGVPAPADAVPRLELPEAVRAAGRERLGRGGVEAAERTVVGLAPGSWGEGGAGERDRWPWRRLAELALALRRRRPELAFVILAGRDELWPAVRVHEETARQHPVVGPDLAADGLAGALSWLDLVVAADGGLLQLAAAVGVATVALSGSAPARLHTPRGAGHRALEAAGGDLRKLGVEPVLEACSEVLGER